MDAKKPKEVTFLNLLIDELQIVGSFLKKTGRKTGRGHNTMTLEQKDAIKKLTESIGTQ
jgi:hypothetical protein